MTRARKICSDPHCAEFQPCALHQRRPWEGSTRSSRLPGNWAKLRRHVLLRDEICQICRSAIATEVDHIEPGDDHGLDNLQGVCVPCHRAKSQREAATARRPR